MEVQRSFLTVNRPQTGLQPHYILLACHHAKIPSVLACKNGFAVFAYQHPSPSEQFSQKSKTGFAVFAYGSPFHI